MERSVMRDGLLKAREAVTTATTKQGGRAMKSSRQLTLQIALRVSLCTVAGGIVTAVAGAWAAPALAQEQASPPIFSWDLTVGWIGMGEFRPVAGKVPPVTNDPKHPFVPNGRGRQPTYRIADLSNPNL